ncbi:hypothetical protein CK516_02140 [Nostoc sp. 'Peltigera malacea cyanobiont' DB3992]|nr:hypothetical protein CK516_02140 [Nostoc sp. 'Peltigera malacea cyanobiont' DB3992]
MVTILLLIKVAEGQEQGQGSRGAGEQGSRGEIAVNFSPLPPAPRPSASFQCPMPNSKVAQSNITIHNGDRLQILEDTGSRRFLNKRSTSECIQ